MADFPPDIITIPLPTPFIIGPVNVFLLKRDPITLVDTGVGNEECYAALASALGQHGLTVKDIEVVLLTHGHVDHIGLLSRLLDESGAKSYGHETVVPRTLDFHEAERQSREFLLGVFTQFGVPEAIVEETRRARENFQGMSGPPRLDHTLKDGDHVFEFEVIHVPGHSSSDTLFFDKRRELAFAGDHVLKGVNPTPLIRRDPVSGQRVKSLLEYERSLARTRALELKWLYPGHGAPITAPAEVIDRISQRHERRTQRVLEAVRERALTPYEVSRVLFPELAPEHTFLALSTAIGHLDILESRREVFAELTTNGTVHYLPIIPASR